jgi:hypothetical protein
MKKYLFITGCSMSGTSVLADLLRSDPRILMGRERFSRLRRKHPEYYSVSLVEQDRFCRQLKQGDSHRKELDDYYERAYQAYDSFEFIGDKYANLSDSYDLLFKKFPNVKIVYIIRNIIEVAHSFELRALKTMFDHGVHNVPDNVWPISSNGKALSVSGITPLGKRGGLPVS